MTEILRRLGVAPSERGSTTNGTCPDIFELSDGRIAVIGTDMTTELTAKIPPDAGVAPYERIVVITRDTMIMANGDITRRRGEARSSVPAPSLVHGVTIRNRLCELQSIRKCNALRLRIVTEIARRIGATPQQRGSVGNGNCPDIFELSDGRFAVIGTDMTAELTAKLPPDAGVAPYERIVVITRDTMIMAKDDIPRL